MRLNKYLQSSGVASRRKADELIKSGQVTVNGEVVREPWHEIDPEKDLVSVRGKAIRAMERPVYYAFYKPRGVTSTLSDRHAKKTLSDYFPHGTPRVYPVGRLDRESEGLMLLTNDGDLSYRLTHPRYGVIKTYRVAVSGGPLTDGELMRLRSGIVLDDGPFRPKKVEKTGSRELLIEISEGRKREIRRAIKCIGREVERLVRVAIGPLRLPEELKPGEMRPLDEETVKKLRESVGLS
ncbi:MAG: pseudouridine synthase [Candidatus Hydrothermota bacterium]|nr:MAG: pseudouridine synthase [Candidatus Hydrothermae bacterium]